MCEYGFLENVDYTPYNFVHPQNKQEIVGHLLKIPMAKEISMIQRNEKGKQARQYFIKCEEAWNSPEMILMKANQIQQKMIENIKKEIASIKLELEYKNEIITGITNNIDVYKKKDILNRVVRHKGANYRERWSELYKVFKETYHIDLKARKEGYNATQLKNKDRCKSVVEYAVKFGHIDNLYNIALKLYETDMNEIIEKIKNVA